MITTFQELGEVLSEFENRLSLIENSMPNRVQVETKQSEPSWAASQWDALNQMKAEVTGWRQKHSEMMLELDRLKMKRRKPQPKYT